MRQDAARQQIALVRKLYAKTWSACARWAWMSPADADEAEQWRIARRRVYARWKVATNVALVSKIEQVVEQSRKS